MNQLPVEWQQWIAENLGRGIAAHAIVETLIQKGFASELATAEVSRLCLTGSPYDYEDDGYAVGNNRVINGHKVSVAMAIQRPRIVLFANVLSKHECETLIELARPRLSRSTTVNDASGQADHHELRSSTGMSFEVNETPFIAELDRRIADLMRLPVANGEGTQIMNYQVGGEYKPHFDFFPPHLLGNDDYLAQGGQRVASLIIYLNSVEEGGETEFPEVGVKFVPIQGSAVYFAYTNSRNQIDPMTLHTGKPVLKGEKWIATKWMRQRRYD